MILSKKGRTLKYPAFCCVYEIMCDSFFSIESPADTYPLDHKGEILRREKLRGYH